MFRMCFFLMAPSLVACQCDVSASHTGEETNCAVEEHCVDLQSTTLLLSLSPASPISLSLSPVSMSSHNTLSSFSLSLSLSLLTTLSDSRTIDNENRWLCTEFEQVCVAGKLGTTCTDPSPPPSHPPRPVPPRLFTFFSSSSQCSCPSCRPAAQTRGSFYCSPSPPRTPQTTVPRRRPRYADCPQTARAADSPVGPSRT